MNDIANIADKTYVCYRGEEGFALYINGIFNSWGSAVEIIGALLDELDGVIVFSDDFVKDSINQEVFGSLDEILWHGKVMGARLEEAKRLRENAQRLIEQAEELENG